MYVKELLIGCGSRRTKHIAVNGNKVFDNVVTLDNNPSHHPDVGHDLKNHPLPFKDNEFDEIHAYEVLEHLASQGDYQFFFKEFSEYWRILKPGGYFCASVPEVSSIWALGDPSHKRIFHPAWLTFLSQDEYTKQVGKTAISDFRSIYKADFNVVCRENKNESFYFALEAKK